MALFTWQTLRLRHLEERLSELGAHDRAAPPVPQIITYVPSSVPSSGASVAPAARRPSHIANASNPASVNAPTPTTPPALVGLEPSQIQAVRTLTDDWTQTLSAAQARGKDADWEAVARAADARDAQLRAILPDTLDPSARAREIASALRGTSITVAAPNGKVYQGTILPRP